MPYTKAQVQLAQAVKHGFKPSGKAKGFTRDFADLVVTEVDNKGMRKVTRTKRIERLEK